MRPTDVCFPSHSLRALALRAFPRARPTALARCWTVTAGSAAFHDATVRFGGLRPFLVGRCLPRRSDVIPTSDTPVARSFPPARSRSDCELRRARRDHIALRLVKDRRASAAWDAFHRWVVRPSSLSGPCFQHPKELNPPFADPATLPSRLGARRFSRPQRVTLALLSSSFRLSAAR